MTTVIDVDPDLTKRLSTSGKKADEWRSKRDETIREAFAAGGGVREIARLVGLTHPSVLRILAKDALQADHKLPASAGTDLPDNLEVVVRPPSVPPTS